MREEEKKKASQKTKNLFKNRWMFPAVYLTSAALLISGIIWYQLADSGDEQVQEMQESATPFNEPAQPVQTSAAEQLALPMKDADESVIKTSFYEESASEKDQEASLVVYNNTYHPNTGIAYGTKEGKTFDVTAALSGKVTKVQENDSLLGNVITIEHANGVTTNYQSVQDIQVAKGDNVSQGQVIAKAGKSLFNEKAGVHLHFEVRDKNNVAINPLDAVAKSTADIAKMAKEAKAEEQKADTEAAEEETQEPAGESSEETSTEPSAEDPAGQEAEEGSVEQEEPAEPTEEESIELEESTEQTEESFIEEELKQEQGSSTMESE
ncbi:M23 family metallopeptidase [Bacillus thermotolerans]|uniref:M23 family metallopeptidase n=1 Tax=Bacillus thermotolerans TaxID=1221996 RepID=UPI000582E900|nr:M23 family metallopeptidase [Bacillus thermotolerans]KKB36541.1 SpoIIQ-like protein [Bacillus thermotolerans]